jgi:hypothetical protein
VVKSEQFDANAPPVPEPSAAARWLTIHYYIQFDANRTISYRKVNLPWKPALMNSQTKAKLRLNSLFMRCLYAQER